MGFTNGIPLITNQKDQELSVVRREYFIRVFQCLMIGQIPISKIHPMDKYQKKVPPINGKDFGQGGRIRTYGLPD